MYSEFCLLHRLGLCGGGGGVGGGSSRIVNFAYFGVWGKGFLLFIFVSAICRYLGVGGDERGHFQN